MQKNKELEFICQKVHFFRIEENSACVFNLTWKEIIQRFKEHPYFNPNREFSPCQYTRYFSEICLDLMLERIEQAYNIDIDLEPKLAEETEKHKFFITPSKRVYAIEKKGILGGNEDFKKILGGSGVYGFEYDRIIRTGNLLVVGEIKLARWKDSIVKKVTNGKRGMHHRYGRGIKNQLRYRFYERKLCPVRMLAGDDVGYFMIIPRDIYEKAERDSNLDSVYNRFKQDNGIVLPFYATREEFRGKVLEIVLEAGLKLKEENSKSKPA